jgi:hypothetical protein
MAKKNVTVRAAKTHFEQVDVAAARKLAKRCLQRPAAAVIAAAKTEPYSMRIAAR